VPLAVRRENQTRAGRPARVKFCGTEFMSTSTVNISATQVKDLRERTGAPMMDCKQALTEAKGDIEQAIIILRKRGAAVAQKKSARVTSEGSVTSYIHAGGKIGVLV